MFKIYSSQKSAKNIEEMQMSYTTSI